MLDCGKNTIENMAPKRNRILEYSKIKNLRQYKTVFDKCKGQEKILL